MVSAQRQIQPRTLVDAVRQSIRVRHYSYRTEQYYVYWVRCFVRFHRGRHPRDMAEAEVGAFLTWLAVQRQVAPETQDQALNALVFLYRQVLEQPLGGLAQVVRAKIPRRRPSVLSIDEVASVLSHLEGMHWMVAGLLYGSGLRLREALGLRIKDLDFPRRAIVVRHGKGGKDRVVTLPDELVLPLQQLIESRRIEHQRDPSHVLTVASRRSRHRPHPRCRTVPITASRIAVPAQHRQRPHRTAPIPRRERRRVPGHLAPAVEMDLPRGMSATRTALRSRAPATQRRTAAL